MEPVRRSIIISTLFLLISNITCRTFSFPSVNERIDCYPESESKYSNYSKQTCLTRNCLFDDAATLDTIQCYLSPNYGYILQDSPEELPNGLRLKLKRNIAVGSMFPQTIDNVQFDVQYYTNDIIRFQFYDADQQRYEVIENEHSSEKNRMNL